MVLNLLIVLNLIWLFFNFILWHLIFYIFFYQIWSLFYWFLFILLLIFFYWILFFDFIFNFFYYNFFLIWSSFLWLQLLLFWVLFLIDFCFGNFILHFLISLNFHIIFSVYFFIILLKPDLGVNPHHVSSHGLGQMIRVIGVNLIFFIVQEVKITLFWKKK
jgi:hypothetical protein